MIIVVGDSWGVGEWDVNCHPGGPGFAQYLMKDHAVINLSIPGGSNGMSLDRLDELLKKYNPSDDDLFYWVVTCPGRCTTQHYFYDSHNLYESIKTLLHASLTKANNISKKYSIKLRLIGGLCDLNDIDTDCYENLKVEVASWCRLLDNSYPTFYFDGAGYWKDLGVDIKSQRPELIEQWIEIADHLKQRRLAYGRMKKTFMKTDGFHPDRDGHQVLLQNLSINKS